MTKNYFPIFITSAVVLIVGVIMVLSKKNQPAGSDMLRVDLQVLKMNGGWGYEVLVDKKVFIHQDCIPAIASYKKFNTEADALLIGRKVVDKLEKGLKPSITQQDVKDAHIRF